jgi:hypothetical protein
VYVERVPLLKAMELPRHISMQIAIHIGDRLLDRTCEKMNWSKRDLTDAIISNRVQLGHTDEGIFIFVDDKAIAGAHKPTLSRTSFENEHLVGIYSGYWPEDKLPSKAELDDDDDDVLHVGGLSGLV